MSKPAIAANVSKIEVLDGKLHIFRRKDTRYWWCGYHNGGVYRRTSTKEADLAAATEAAKKWYYGEQYQLTTGQKPVRTKDTYAYHAKLAIEDYQRLGGDGTRSARYARALKHLIENHLIPFFGKYKLTAINQALWNEYVEKHLIPRNVKPLTVKQHLNGIRVVFRRTILRGTPITTPVFHTERATAAHATPRTWFTEQELMKLITALHQNIKDKKGTRWEFAAFELCDYVNFMVNTGLRVDEGKNLRFKDVSKIKETDQHGVLRETLYLDPVRGKRGTGACKTLFAAVAPFERIVERRGLALTWQASDAPVFLEHHRDMFNTVLTACKLKHTNHKPPLRRDLMSLRNTYICHRIKAAVPVFDIALTCRTSTQMIQQNYARWLKATDVNINLSRPQSEEQKKKEARKASEKYMPAVLAELNAVLEEAEREFAENKRLRGSDAKQRRDAAKD